MLLMLPMLPMLPRLQALATLEPLQQPRQAARQLHQPFVRPSWLQPTQRLEFGLTRLHCGLVIGLLGLLMQPMCLTN